MHKEIDYCTKENDQISVNHNEYGYHLFIIIILFFQAPSTCHDMFSKV